MAGEQGVQARHGQFRMMCSSTIVPATPTSVEPCRMPATTEEDVFGRSTVFKNWKDAVVGQETPAQSGGVQESMDMFTDTFLPIADMTVDSTTRVAQKPQGAREGVAGRRGAKSVAHTELLPQEGRTVEKRRHGTQGGGGEEGGEEGGGEHASVTLKYHYKNKHAKKEFDTNLQVKT